MISASYEITALVARYVLFFLCVIILLRTLFISTTKHRTIKTGDNNGVAKITDIKSGRIYDLGYDCIVGSSKRCDIKIEGRGVSAIHIQIYKQNNHWIICTFSKKPTLLNEIKIGGKEIINTNDIIKIGAKSFQFILPNGDTI